MEFQQMNRDNWKYIHGQRLVLYQEGLSNVQTSDLPEPMKARLVQAWQFWIDYTEDLLANPPQAGEQVPLTTRGTYNTIFLDDGSVAIVFPLAIGAPGEWDEMVSYSVLVPQIQVWGERVPGYDSQGQPLSTYCGTQAFVPGGIWPHEAGHFRWPWNECAADTAAGEILAEFYEKMVETGRLLAPFGVVGPDGRILGLEPPPQD